MIQAGVTGTMEKFGYPATLIRDYPWWAVLTRPRQATLGSLILAAKCDVDAFSQLPPDAFSGLGAVTADIERALCAFVRYERINYLMLMMVDPHPHFHVIPRYQGAREFDGLSVADEGWPGPPQLGGGAALSQDQIANLTARLKSLWPE